MPKIDQPDKRSVRITGAFRRDLVRATKHRKCDLEQLHLVMSCLEFRAVLDRKYLDHALTGRFPNQRSGQTGCRECHTSNDWLLVYRLVGDDTVDFIRTGTHADLFG
jgi:mRNA interferase YafQ